MLFRLGYPAIPRRSQQPAHVKLPAPPEEVIDIGFPMGKIGEPDLGRSLISCQSQRIIIRKNQKYF
jgi:hypothetical protein